METKTDQQPITDYNKIPQRFHKYTASDRAKKIV